MLLLQIATLLEGARKGDLDPCLRCRSTGTRWAMNWLSVLKRGEDPLGHERVPKDAYSSILAPFCGGVCVSQGEPGSRC